MSKTLKNKVKFSLPEQQKVVKYLDSLPASSAGKSEKVRKIQILQSTTDRELKLLEKSVLSRAFGG